MKVRANQMSFLVSVAVAALNTTHEKRSLVVRDARRNSKWLNRDCKRALEELLLLLRNPSVNRAHLIDRMHKTDLYSPSVKSVAASAYLQACALRKKRSIQ